MFRMSFEDSNTSYDVKMESVLPYGVEGHCCAFHNGYIYIIGGYDGISVIDTIVRYSVSDRSSEILPTQLSIARENHVCEIIFNRYLVVMAGWDGRQALDSVEVFEIVEEAPFLIPLGIEFSLCQKRNRPASVAVIVP
ncbi:kelch repeat protein [Teladorsagia circumcincta]|uniref:Kelch repeat protein n=1 Tax=Teladorsagia circumcincta TaxID=45464 RepID=A0A2G9T4L6_TELCI|nr:kelch repeat protein [Teladorsagia circumcincta]